MAKSVAESLIENKCFDSTDMSKRFTIEFFRHPERVYGTHVRYVFAELRNTDYEDPYGPARKQFNGQGSFGNGAAMRTGPIPLFGCRMSEEDLIELAINCAEITHSHRIGYNGAVLQSLAIREALRTQTNPTDNTFDLNLFLNPLIDKMRKIESLIECEDNCCEGSESDKQCMKTSFTDKLKRIQEILETESKTNESIPTKKVAEILGNDISADESVPAAIYSVLRAQKPIDDFENDNPFVRTLYYAISLGGDTDTIGCMACSIARALYGIELIPKALQKYCEDMDVMMKYSEDLYNIFNK